jgi:hypothetical protein
MAQGWQRGRKRTLEHTQRILEAKAARRLGTMVKRTMTEERIPVDSTKQTILDALRLSSHLVLESWVEKLLSTAGVDYILIAKRVRGEFVDVTGAYHPGASPPEGWEEHVVRASWGGAGVYHFQIVHKSEVVGGRVFKLGGPEAITSAEGGLDDADAALSRTFKRMELLQGSKIALQLEKKFGLDGGEGTETMRPEDYRAILDGVKAMQPAPPVDTMGPMLLKMWEAAEQRNQTMLTLLLTQRDKPDATVTIIPSIVEGLKSLGPRVLGPAMSTIVERFFPTAAPPDGGWTMAGVMSLVQAASPMAQQLIEAFLKMAAGRNGAPTPGTVLPPDPAALASAPDAIPLAAPAMEDTMRQPPQPPSEEQLAAMRAHAEIVGLLKGYLVAGDYEAAWDCLLSTPAFEPWTDRLDPGRPAQVYAPFLMTVLGLTLADAARAVEQFYQILLREDEAAARAEPPKADSAADE